MSPAQSAPTARVMLLGRARAMNPRTEERFAAPPRTLPMLALLAFQRGHTIDRSRVAELLWPDFDRVRGMDAVRRHLSYLTKGFARIGTPLVIERTADGKGLRIDAGSLDLDVVAFDKAIGERRFEEAISLYGGDLLEGLDDDEWLTPFRNRFRSLYDDALAELLQRDSSLGDVMRAGRWAERLRERDPYNDAHARALILAWARAGDRDGAIEEYERHASLLRRELGVEPAPETTALAECVRETPMLGLAFVPPGAAPEPMRQHRDAIVGRSVENARALELLRGARVVTLVGPPGIGKTTLAHSIVRDLHAPVTVLRLAEVEDDDRALALVAGALGVRNRLVTSENLDDVLADVPLDQRLLLIDNCEHLLPIVRRIVHALLSASPRLTILATSRTRLDVRGERVVELGPLSADASEVLFLKHWCGLSQTRLLPAEAARSVASVCRMADGVPLALVIAGSYAASLGVEAVESVLARGGGLQDTQNIARTTSMHRAVARSVEALDRETAALFARISVFIGRFTLTQVDAVCAERNSPGTRTALAMKTLVDRSLLLHEEADERYFSMLEPLRDFARAALDEMRERPAVEARLSEYIERFAEDRERVYGTIDYRRWKGAIDTLAPTLTAYLPKWIDTDPERCGRIVGRLRSYWGMTMPATAIGWCDRLLECSLADETRARVLQTRATMLTMLGKGAEALDVFERARELFAPIDPFAEAVVIHNEGVASTTVGDLDRARLLLDRAFSYFSRSEDGSSAHAARRSQMLANCVHDRAVVDVELGKYADAITVFDRALALLRDSDDMRTRASAHLNIGLAHALAGNLEEGMWHTREGTALMHAMGDAVHEGVGWTNLCFVHLSRGEPADARAALAKALDALDGTGADILQLRAVEMAAFASEASGAGVSAARLLGFVEARQNAQEAGRLEIRALRERFLERLRKRFSPEQLQAYRREGGSLHRRDALRIARTTCDGTVR